LLLVGYPSAVPAKAAYEQFNRVYFPDQPGSTDSMRIEKVENDEYVSIRWSDRYLILVFEAKDPKTCAWLSEAVEERIKGARE
jgi:thioredoxin-related protein